MSLFGTKKKVYVSSTTYKMIDDGEERTSFMREVIASTALSNGANTSFAAAISRAHLEGPRASLKGFFRWAKSNFDMALPRAAIDYTQNIDYAVVEAQIRDDVFAGASDVEININQAFIDIADESYYAEQFIYENREELSHLDWAADVDPATNDIWIQYPAGTEYLGSPLTSESFSVSGFNTSNKVLVVYYTFTDPPSEESFVRVYIYKIGDGNDDIDDFDVVLEDGAAAREFYPFIPLRINNLSVFAATSPAKPHEEIIRKAYKKLLGQEIDDALTEIQANPSIGNIDYAYLVPGVCLNSPSKYEKLFIYEFFKGLAEKQQSTAGDYEDYVDDNNLLGYHPSILNGPLLNTLADNDPLDLGYLTGVSTATRSVNPRITNIHLTLPTPDLGVMDMRITWSDISESLITGVMEQGANPGDVLIRKGTSFQQTNTLPLAALVQNQVSAVGSIVIRKQISRSQFVEIVVKGLMHKNLIYKGKSVDITSEEALNDPDESGFIIPLHEPTLKRLGVVTATELARESFLMVFNSYQVVKTKWYQKGIFKAILTIILVVIVVILIYYFGPEAGLAAKGGAGILGTNLAIGSALGFTGVLAIAVGAAVNAIAAMIVVKLVSAGATELFGEKIGAAITMITSVFLALGSGPGGLSLDNVAANIGNMASIDKLMMLTSATTDIVQFFQQDQLQKTLLKIQEASTKFQEQMLDLDKLWDAAGFGDSIIDPSMLVDYTNPLVEMKVMGEKFTLPPTFNETMDSFLSRTLMTGSDLAELSQAMVNDFVKATLTLR